MDKFEEFLQKEKFIEDKTLFYAGIGYPTMRPILTDKVAYYFKEVANSENRTRT